MNSSRNINLLVMHMNFELSKAGSEGNYDSFKSFNLMPDISIDMQLHEEPETGQIITTQKAATVIERM